MKLLVIFIIILNSVFLSGQDFYCPEEVNFGDFNIIAKTDSSSNFTLSYTPSFRIYKIVQDEIYFQDGIVYPLYDSSIAENGNYLQFMDGNYDKDTLEMSFRLTYKYLDSISSLGEFLEYEFTFFYLKQGNDFLDSQKVTIKLRLKNEKELFLANEGRRSFINRSSNKYGDSSITSSEHGYLLNFTEDNFIIDSVKQDIKGMNFYKVSFGSLDPLKFPYNLKQNKKLYFQHNYFYLKPETGRSIISFYGHFENNNESIILKDTYQLKFDISDGIYFYNSYRQYYFSIYAVDTVKMSTITISNNTDSLLKFISFNINPSPGLLAYFKKVATEPPCDINPWKRYSIKEIYIQADNPGKYKLKVSMNFEKENGEKFTKDMDLIIVAIPKRITDIIRVDGLTDFLIYPNPASDYIEINVPRWRWGEHHSAMFTGVDLRIFDILGIEQPTSPQPLSMLGEGLRIDISGLSPGVYFVCMSNIIQRFIKH